MASAEVSVMKAIRKSLIITGATVLALAVVWVSLRLTPDQPSSFATVFTAVEPIEISSVLVQNATETYRFYYENDGYVLDDIPATIADIDAFIGFMVNCGRLSAIRQVDGGTLEEYGLTKPAATVEISFFSGSPVLLFIGAQEKISGNYYASAEGTPGVYLLAASMAEPFLRPKTQVISPIVTPALAMSSPLSAIRDVTFTGGGLKDTIVIQAVSSGNHEVRVAALSFGTATHLIHGAGVYQLDQTYGVEILGSLFGIQALAVEGYGLTENEILAMGFDDPWMIVEYDMLSGAGAAPEYKRLLLVRASDGLFFATTDGSGAVFQIGRQAFMDIQYDRLPVRWFLSPMLMDLSAVSIEGGEKQYRFDINNEDRKNPIVTCEGEALDISLFRAFFRLITSAAHDGTYQGVLEQTGEELLVITYEYLEPNKAPDILSLYTGGVRRANVFVNGIGEFAMKDQFIARVLEGCESLLAGQAIEESWQ